MIHLCWAISNYNRHKGVIPKGGVEVEDEKTRHERCCSTRAINVTNTEQVADLEKIKTRSILGQSRCCFSQRRNIVFKIVGNLTWDVTACPADSLRLQRRKYHIHQRFLKNLIPSLVNFGCRWQLEEPWLVESTYVMVDLKYRVIKGGWKLQKLEKNILSFAEEFLRSLGVV